MALKSGLILPETAVKPTPNTRKICHIFNIPMTYMLPDPVIASKVNVEAKMAFVDCMGDKCNLWNFSRAECWDVSSRRATVETRDLIEQIDGLMRMHNEKE